MVVIGMDFGKSQKSVAVAAVLHKHRLKRGLNALNARQKYVPSYLLLAAGFEIEFLDSIAVHNYDTRFFLVGGINEQLPCHFCLSIPGNAAANAAACDGKLSMESVRIPAVGALLNAARAMPASRRRRIPEIPDSASIPGPSVNHPRAAQLHRHVPAFPRQHGNLLLKRIARSNAPEDQFVLQTQFASAIGSLPTYGGLGAKST